MLWGEQQVLEGQVWKPTEPNPTLLGRGYRGRAKRTDTIESVCSSRLKKKDPSLLNHSHAGHQKPVKQYERQTHAAAQPAATPELKGGLTKSGVCSLFVESSGTNACLQLKKQTNLKSPTKHPILARTQQSTMLSTEQSKAKLS